MRIKTWLFFFLAGANAWGSDLSTAATEPLGAATSPPMPSSTVSVIQPGEGRNSEVHLYGSFDVKVSGKLAREMASDVASARKNVTLYLNGVRMANIAPFISAAPDGSSDVLLRFRLDRIPDDDENREAWDTLLRRVPCGTTHIEVAIGSANQLPVYAPENEKLRFRVNSARWQRLSVLLGVGILLLGFYCVFGRWNEMLREGGGSYSLGRSQMAFWSLLVISCFVAVLVVSQWQMERIPSQVLILLGISGATGLSAKLIGSSNKRAAPRGSTGSWLRDILRDDTGPSFPRLQILLWNLVLGVVFVVSVFRTLSMPEFSDTLLALMGISNGTYLGFKIQEK